jgi:hypothetical protein
MRVACERCGATENVQWSEQLGVDLCGRCFEASGDKAETYHLLEDIRTFVRRFVVLPTPIDGKDVSGDLLALWVLHTHAFEASWATPYLRITSAAPDSGKTLLLEVLAAICRRGWHAINPSVAVLYRKVERDQPTLLLDEMDNYPLEDRKDALSILNAGYKRGARVPRCNERGDLQEFGVFCPKAYAGLDERQLVPTLLSRSITIRMQTKLRSQDVDMWIAPLVEPEAEELRVRCEEWAERHVETLADVQPDVVGLMNRKAEVWWALLAIGEYVGGEWQERAREAARVLGAGGDDADQPSQQVQLLTDIRAAFGHERTIFTETLLTYLNELEESPWGARRRGDGLDSRGLARLLRPFRIRPKEVRVGEQTRRGYHVDQFEDAFGRYLPGLAEAKHGHTSETSASLSQADVSHVSDVSPSGGERNAGDGSGGHGVARKPSEEDKARFSELGRPVDLNSAPIAIYSKDELGEHWDRQSVEALVGRTATDLLVNLYGSAVVKGCASHATAKRGCRYCEAIIADHDGIAYTEEMVNTGVLEDLHDKEPTPAP